MRRVTDGEEAFAVPGGETTRLHRQEVDVLPLPDRVYPIRQLGYELCHLFAEGVQACLFDCVAIALENDVPELPLIGTCQHDDETASTDSKARHVDRALGVTPGQDQPHHVHRRGALLRHKTCESAESRSPAVGGDGQGRPEFTIPTLVLVADSANGIVFDHQVTDPGPHNDEVEKLDLRNRRDEGETRPDSCEVRQHVHARSAA